MSRVRRANALVQGAREASRIAATLGGDLRLARVRRRLTQCALGDRVGLSQGRISDLERGEGASAPLDTWIALGIALDRPLAISFSREIETDEPRDAGHLRAQDLVLGFARRLGRGADIELPTRPMDPSRAVDVVMRDDLARALILVEIWNRLDDLGAAIRSSARKAAEADGLAVLAAGDGPPFRVGSCWILVDSAANRRLVARYPEIFAARFRGSSVGWVRCLVEGAAPPPSSGLVWIDTRAGKIVAVRHRRFDDHPATST